MQTTCVTFFTMSTFLLYKVITFVDGKYICLHQIKKATQTKFKLFYVCVQNTASKAPDLVQANTVVEPHHGTT